MLFEFNPKLFSPLYWHLKPLLRDERIRYIFVEGGSSAAKTFSICQAILVDQIEHNYSSLVFRRYHVHIRDSVYSSFKAAAKSLQLDQYHTFQQDLIKCDLNTARVRFRGLDDEENIKGIEDFNIVYNNEWSQFIEDHWGQQRKRLRGRPGQKFICDWNPISSKLWQYENWIDLDTWVDMPLDMKDAPTKYSSLNPDFAFKRVNRKGDAIWMKVTYRDNFWVVGHPSGKGGYVDRHTLDDFERDRVYKPNLYRVYANGERGIMRTGGEFWKQFDETRHVKPVKIEGTTIHLSLDENVNPYVTVAAWQAVGKELRQVHEIPCKSPENNAPKAAKRTAKWLESIGYKDVVYIYGDPSAGKRSTVDENNRSFFDKFIEVLRAEGFHVVSRVARSAPEVALSAAFINDIYESGYMGYSITISDKCKVSIDDYCTVKEDMDGKMLKEKVKDPATGITYEPNGHFCVIGDTRIKTVDGEKAIKDIKVGDYVLTRQGYKRVLKHVLSFRNKEVYTYDFGHTKLTCTDNHKIFTVKGFKEAASLMQSDIFCILDRTKNTLCNQKLSLTRGAISTGILTRNLYQIGAILKDGYILTAGERKNTCTDTNGCRNTGLFLRGITFIILMAITLIIQLITWGCCIIANTYNTITNYSRKSLKTLRQRFFYLLPKKLQKSGTVQQRVLSGTENRQQSPLSTENISIINANVAGSSLGQTQCIPPASVPTTVNLTIEERKVKTLKCVLAQCAELNLKLIGIQRRVLVQGNVPHYLESNQDVYDIEVDEAHEFVANGILIHNSDQKRYFITTLLKDIFNNYKARSTKRLAKVG